MANHLPLTDKNGEVRELTADDFKQFKSAAEVLPPDLLTALPKRRPGQRGPSKHPTKEAIQIRLSPDILSVFRATGQGWQTRVNDALRDWLKTHPAAR